MPLPYVPIPGLSTMTLFSSGCGKPQNVNNRSTIPNDPIENSSTDDDVEISNEKLEHFSAITNDLIGKHSISDAQIKHDAEALHLTSHPKFGCRIVIVGGGIRMEVCLSQQLDLMALLHAGTFESVINDLRREHYRSYKRYRNHVIQFDPSLYQIYQALLTLSPIAPRL